MWKIRKCSSRCIALLLLACTSCSKDKSASEPASSAAASASAKSPALPGVDQALLSELQTIGKTCQKSPGEDRFRCPGAQNWKLIGDFMGKRRDRAAAVGALAVALADPEPGVRGLAVSVLHSAFGGSWGRDTAPGTVPPEAARALLDNVLGQPAATVQQAVPAAVNAAMLAGQGEPLYAALAKPEHAALRTSAYPYLMTLGRLEAFPKIQQLVKDSEPRLAEAAAEAPINMDAWTEAEKNAICAWSDGLLSDPRHGVGLKASLLLSHCSGARLEKLLAWADELAVAGKLDATAQGPLIAMCGGAQRPKTLTATPAQCARSRKLLVGVAESKQGDASARAQAVTWIAQIWPDEASAKMLKRLKGDADAVVARQAGDSLKRLDEAAAQLSSAQLSSSSTPSKP